MSKKFVSPKKLRKAIRKNPYKVGITALLALGGVAAAAASRTGQLRALKEGIVRGVKHRDEASVPAPLSAAANI